MKSRWDGPPLWTLFLLLLASSCYSAKPENHKQLCAKVSQGLFCPTGYYCAIDGTCWIDGTGPATGNGGQGGAVGGVGGARTGGTGGASGGTSGGGTTGGAGLGGAASGGLPFGGTAGRSINGGSSTGGGPSGGTGGGLGGGGRATGGGPGGARTGGNGGAATGGSPPLGGARTGGAGGGMAGGAATGGAMTGCTTLPTTVIAANNVIQFNDNGGWAWHQDERAIVDATKRKFVIGSVASGGSRNGDIEAVIYDLATGSKSRTKLGAKNPDDRAAPAFALRADGKYLASFTGYREDCLTSSAIFDGSSWGAVSNYLWSGDGCPWDSTNDYVSYTSPWFLSGDNGSFFNAVRTASSSPGVIKSADGGSTWAYYGRWISPPLGILAGYYKYWGNGTDRIDFVGTEGHPRDVDSNLWHGYYKAGKLYDSAGQIIDDDASGGLSSNISTFTKVLSSGLTLSTSGGSVTLGHMWNHDIVRYGDGTIAVLGQGRVNGTGASSPDLRMTYSRWDGQSWKSSYLVKAGLKLNADEQDFTGLSALHPDLPNVIFVSTSIDPRTDATTTSGKREIFLGATCDNGATWKWSPLTEGSTVDNLRPVVPKWDANHTLLLWLKGTFTSSQAYSLQVVGTTSLSTSPP